MSYGAQTVRCLGNHAEVKDVLNYELLEKALEEGPFYSSFYSFFLGLIFGHFSFIFRLLWASGASPQRGTPAFGRAASFFA